MSVYGRMDRAALDAACNNSAAVANSAADFNPVRRTLAQRLTSHVKRPLKAAA